MSEIITTPATLQVEILNLENLDPKNDLIIVRLPFTRKTPSHIIRKHIENIRKSPFILKIKEKGFEIALIPMFGNSTTRIERERKETPESISYDDAMRVEL